MRRGSRNRSICLLGSRFRLASGLMTTVVSNLAPTATSTVDACHAPVQVRRATMHLDAGIWSRLPWLHQPNVLGVSRTAGPACPSRSGAAVAAEELRSHDWRTATAVTPPRWR